MDAYEFFADPVDGFIQIPEQYKNVITSPVKVIILAKKTRKLDQISGKAHKKSDMLLSPTMSTKGWKFDREEANEHC